MGASARKYSAELLDKIRHSVNLVELVGEHVVLRKSGANHVGLCPFHAERTPSFSVSENKQLFHCYGCQKGGDLFTFVAEIHGISFPEAVEELADRARVPLPADSSGGVGASDPAAEARRQAARARLETAHRLTRFVAAFYHQNLKNIPEAARYLRGRGVGDQLVRAFYLGAAPAGWDSLAHYLQERQAPRELAAELGLIRPSTHPKGASSPGNGFFDLFRNRVVFPILDTRGKVAGFGGRALADEEPKYLNSTESFLFQKSRLVYGLFQAQKHIREKDEVILVEGYFDVLALHAAGFENAVACCGTSLTPDHLNLFRRFASRITILFDGDKAGIAATDRAMVLGLENGLVLRGAVLPEGKDPDEILIDQASGEPVESGRARMEEILGQARPLLDRRIEEAIGFSQQGPDAKAQAIKRVAGWLSRFSDPVGREVRLDFFQQKINISRDLLDRAMAPGGGRTAELRGHSALMPSVAGAGPVRGPGGGFSAAQRSHGRPIARQNQRNQGVNRGLGPADRILLAGWVRGGEMSRQLADAGAKLPPGFGLSDLFDYGPAREWVLRREQEAEPLKPLQVTSENLTQVDLDPQLRSTLTEALVNSAMPLNLSDFQIVVDRAIARCWARFSQRIKLALSEAEAKQDAGLQAKLMKEYLDVQRKMKEFNSFYDEA